MKKNILYFIWQYSASPKRSEGKYINPTLKVPRVLGRGFLFIVFFAVFFISGQLFAAEEGSGRMESGNYPPIFYELEKIPSENGVLFWNEVEKIAHVKGQKAKFMPVEIKYDKILLNEKEKKMLAYLIEAAKAMNEIYLRQVYPGNLELRDKLSRSSSPVDKVLLSYFEICFGPFDPIDENKNFINNVPFMPQAGFYPSGMTKDEFNDWVKKYPEDANAFTSWYTVIKRKGNKLVAVPYSEEYGDLLVKASDSLKKAAELCGNNSLKRFLQMRAEAFLNDNYYDSELAWMDVNDSKFEVVIGPYEVYTDRLFNNKTAFEAFICLNDPVEAKKLEVYAQYLRAMEDNLPIPSKYKNFDRSFSSPLRVVQEIYAAGDTRAGIQTSAFNLPNDEKVREVKGCKKVMLKNIMEAKFNNSLIPISRRIIEPSCLDNVTFDSYFNHVVFHELSHGLGPGVINKNGKKADTREFLEETYSIIEEAKADTLGTYNILFLMRKGIIPESKKKDLFTSGLAGIFRSIRFGINEAHGKATMIQFNWMAKEGAIKYNPDTGYYSVDSDKLEPALTALVKELLMIEALGDKKRAEKLIKDFGNTPDYIFSTLNKLVDIPVDIEPIFEADKI